MKTRRPPQQLNVRLRPKDAAAIARLQRVRDEGVSDLIRRLLHDAVQRDDQRPGQHSLHAQRRQPGDI